MRNYPDPKDGDEWKLDVTQQRRDDVQDFDDLPKRFVKGRLVSRIPATSLDVLDTDKTGDIVFTDDFIYVLVLIAGVNEWRRADLGVF